MKFSRTKRSSKNEPATPQDAPAQASLPLAETDGVQELAGRIERVTFSNPENGFTVARVRLPGSRHPVTVVGAMLDALPGQEFKFTGRWKEDPRYGPQFLAESAVQAMPVEEDGIRLFLGSGVIKGVGPELANRIVNHFKAETLDVLDRFPERLREVGGVGAKKAEDGGGRLGRTARSARGHAVFPVPRRQCGTCPAHLQALRAGGGGRGAA